jgi:hypothetical protein
MDRDAVIARYRHLRAITVKHNSAVLRHVSRPEWIEQARRLGLLMVRNTIVADSEDEMTLIFDLAIYSPRRGRSRPIELYRRAARLAPDCDEARVLDAMCAARFAIWRVERRHELAGLIVHDLMREAEVWLMDLGMEATADEGRCFASHLFAPAAFSMTTGIIVPVDRDIIEDALDDLPPARHAAPDVLAADPLFATLVCRAALLDGAMERIAFA